jgi:hypothetical protein
LLIGQGAAAHVQTPDRQEELEEFLRSSVAALDGDQPRTQGECGRRDREDPSTSAWSARLQ